MSWLSGGTVTARVEDEWDLTETRIDMDWRLVLDRVQAGPPAGAGAAEAVLARALGSALDRAGGSGDFAVTLALAFGFGKLFGRHVNTYYLPMLARLQSGEKNIHPGTAAQVDYTFALFNIRQVKMVPYTGKRTNRVIRYPVQNKGRIPQALCHV